MSISDVSCIQREKSLSTKLMVSKKLLKLSNEFYNCLKVIADLDLQKIAQLKILKRFSSIFYEHDSVYKELMNSWTLALQTEILSLEQRCSVLNSIENFSLEMKKAYEDLAVC